MNLNVVLDTDHRKFKIGRRNGPPGIAFRSGRIKKLDREVADREVNLEVRSRMLKRKVAESQCEYKGLRRCMKYLNIGRKEVFFIRLRCVGFRNRMIKYRN